MLLLNTFLDRLELLLITIPRMLGLLVTAPIFANRLVPVQARVALAVVLGLLIVPMMGPGGLPADLLHLIPVLVKELAVGMTIGFVCLLLFAAVQLAGELVDINTGLSMMAIVDPGSDITLPVLGNIKYTLAMLVFLAIDGHHLLIAAVVQSYRVVPIDGFAFTGAAWAGLSRLMGAVFLLALQIAAPTLAALFITDVALGLLNRTMPQLNVFIMGMPVKMAVALTLLAAATPLYVTLLQYVFGRMGSEIDTLLKLLVAGGAAP